MKKKLITGIILTVLAVSAYFLTRDDAATLAGYDTEFAVKDVESLSRIFIATTSGSVADLKKKDGVWYINDKNEARVDAINFTLEALENLKIHSPVSNKGLEAHTKDLASRHKKVELYKNNEKKPFKTLYIGTANQTLSANLCLLETAKRGKAKRPYYVMKLGHRGIISPIFFTTEREWLNTRIIEYPNLNFKNIELIYPLDSSRSFGINKNGGDFGVYDPITGIAYKQKEVNKFLLSEYVERYKMVHFEATNEDFPQDKLDSLLASTPIAVLKTTNISGATDSIQIFRAQGQFKDIDGNVLGEGDDLDYFHGWYHNKLVKLQRFVFNPLLYVKEDFIMQD